MGECAEMLLDGTLCCECGVALMADTGYPTKCENCDDEK